MGGNCADESLPYSTAELNAPEFSTPSFRMYHFKVTRCSKRYVHDWRACPFAHPTENARRRDPRVIEYLPVPCPDYKRGFCLKGDGCSYSHGVYECWLHPAKYRTQLCKEGGKCRRPVCFFAHSVVDLRQPGNESIPPLPSQGSLGMQNYNANNINRMNNNNNSAATPINNSAGYLSVREEMANNSVGFISARSAGLDSNPSSSESFSGTGLSASQELHINNYNYVYNSAGTTASQQSISPPLPSTASGNNNSIYNSSSSSLEDVVITNNNNNITSASSPSAAAAAAALPVSLPTTRVTSPLPSPSAPRTTRASVDIGSSELKATDNKRGSQAGTPKAGGSSSSNDNPMLLNSTSTRQSCDDPAAAGSKSGKNSSWVVGIPVNEQPSLNGHGGPRMSNAMARELGLAPPSRNQQHIGGVAGEGGSSGIGSGSPVVLPQQQQQKTAARLAVTDPANNSGNGHGMQQHHQQSFDPSNSMPMHPAVAALSAVHSTMPLSQQPTLEQQLVAAIQNPALAPNLHQLLMFHNNTTNINNNGGQQGMMTMMPQVYMPEYQQQQLNNYNGSSYGNDDDGNSTNSHGGGIHPALLKLVAENAAAAQQQHQQQLYMDAMAAANGGRYPLPGQHYLNVAAMNNHNNNGNGSASMASLLDTFGNFGLAGRGSGGSSSNDNNMSSSTSTGSGGSNSGGSIHNNKAHHNHYPSSSSFSSGMTTSASRDIEGSSHHTTGSSSSTCSAPHRGSFEGMMGMASSVGINITTTTGITDSNSGARRQQQQQAQTVGDGGPFHLPKELESM